MFQGATSAVETRIANDVEELLKWIESKGDLPRTINDANFQIDRLWAACQRWASRSFRLISVINFSLYDSAKQEPFAVNRVFHSQKARKAFLMYPGQPSEPSLCKAK